MKESGGKIFIMVKGKKKCLMEMFLMENIEKESEKVKENSPHLMEAMSKLSG